jgi:glycosyltransferase involved in cell wall biosynthesis
MERVAYELSQQLSKISGVKLIKWGGSNKWLPLVLPCLLFKSLWTLFTADIQVVYLEDGLLAPLGLILKIFTRKPVTATIHGLDITYKNRLYQSVVPKCIRRLDRVICISDYTKKVCLNKGIPERKIRVIPDGISDGFYIHDRRQNLKEKLSKKLEINLENKKILLSVGRLVERKGIHWFVENVMPEIAAKEVGCIHLIAGDGNFSSQVQKAIGQNNLNDSVRMLGRVDDETLKLLYNVSDIFVMPNIPVKGDMEGFGVVVLEASSCALPVIASNLEGIRDAVQDGKNGILVDHGYARGFVDRLLELLENNELRKSFGTRARKFTLDNYGWESIAQNYLDEFKAIT